MKGARLVLGSYPNLVVRLFTLTLARSPVADGLPSFADRFQHISLRHSYVPSALSLVWGHKLGNVNHDRHWCVIYLVVPFHVTDAISLAFLQCPRHIPNHHHHAISTGDFYPSARIINVPIHLPHRTDVGSRVCLGVVFAYRI